MAGFGLLSTASLSIETIEACTNDKYDKYQGHPVGKAKEYPGYGSACPQQISAHSSRNCALDLGTFMLCLQPESCHSKPLLLPMPEGYKHEYN